MNHIQNLSPWRLAGSPHALRHSTCKLMSQLCVLRSGNATLQHLAYTTVLF